MKFKGELHQVKLINFSVDIEEVEHLVPKKLKIFQENGKAIISMVDVQLKEMRTTWLPFIKFGYRHVAFRLLLNDKSLSQENEPKGIFFLKAFSRHRLLNWGGNLIGNYNLSFAKMSQGFDVFNLIKKDKHIEYALNQNEEPNMNAKLYQQIKRIDRAYAQENSDVLVTQIAREEWPIEPVKCVRFSTNFFKSANLLGAFQIKKPIDYTWENPLNLSL
jgi:hypothetical protein